MAQAMHIR